MSSANPLNDEDFEGYLIPAHAMFITLLLQYFQPWTAVLSVFSRIVLYFVVPWFWLWCRPATYFKLFLYILMMLPWMLKCVKHDLPSIDSYCSISALLSVLPAYSLLYNWIIHSIHFRSLGTKIYSCLITLIFAVLAAVYSVEGQTFYAIQQAFPFVHPREAFGVSFVKETLDSSLPYVQKGIYILFGAMLGPMTLHMYIVILVLFVRLIFTKRAHHVDFV